MNPKKSLGQNFLINQNIITKIVASLDLKENDLVIEIGPGRGALTKEIKKYNPNILAFEIDKDMHHYLDSLEDKKTKVIYQDVLKSDIKSFYNDIKYENLYIIGNLPYYITTPIIEYLISLELPTSSLVFMVQKEVAERFMAKPNTKEYGYFSLYLQFYYDIECVVNVSKTNFFPIPKVDSEVIKLIPKEMDLNLNEEKYFKFLKMAFKYKRKTLKNNLGNERFLRVYIKLKELNYNENVRAEQIKEEDYKLIYNL